MKKRPIIICLFVAILGSVIFWLQSNYIITGWLKGEAFYQGRPTSYWRQNLGNVHSVRCWHSIPGPGGPDKVFYQSRSSLPEWLDPIIGNRTPLLKDDDSLPDHPLWMGDPEARDVLTQLTEGSTSTIRDFAKEGLARIKKD